MAHRLNDHSLAVVAGAFMSLAAHAGPACEMQWSGPLGDGPNGQVWSMTVFDDGNGPQLYIGGGFSTFGDLPAPVGVVKWDGTTLSLGPPVSAVRNMAVYDDGTGPALYLANGGLKKWDGQSVTELPGSPGAYNITVYDDGSGPKLITCGGFGDGTIHQWDGTNWTMIGGFGGPASMGVYELAPLGPYLYVGGYFDNPFNLARWDGRDWWGAGGVFGFGCNPVNMLEPHNTPLGPRLFVAASTSGCGLEAWDSLLMSWGTPTPYSGGSVQAMAAFDDGTGSALWVVGNFTSIADLPAQRIAKFDGIANWATVLPGANDIIRAVAVFDDGSGPALYVAGSFTSVGGVQAEGVARFGCPVILPPDCPADLTDNGVVDGIDLALLLGLWGCTGTPATCAADLNGNGIVEGFDLAILLGAWGPCP